jgi:hypothetical protein
VNRKRVENDARAWVDGALASSAGTEEGVLRLVVDYRFRLFYKPSLEPEVLTTQKLESLANHYDSEELMNSAYLRTSL